MFDLVSFAIKLLLSDDNSRKAIAKANDAQIYRLMGMMSYYTRWIPLSFEKIFYYPNRSDKHGDAKHDTDLTTSCSSGLTNGAGSSCTSRLESVAMRN